MSYNFYLIELSLLLRTDKGTVPLRKNLHDTSGNPNSHESPGIIVPIGI